MGLANIARGGGQKGQLKLPQAPVVTASTVQSQGGSGGSTARAELKPSRSLGIDLENNSALARESRGDIGNAADLGRDGGDIPISVHQVSNIDLPKAPSIGVSTPHATGNEGNTARGEGTPGGKPEPRGSVTGPPQYPNETPGWKVDPSYPTYPGAATPGYFDPEDRKN